MVPAFFKDPLDGASVSSNTPSNQGNDLILVGDESSTGTNPKTLVANATPSDAESIEVVLRNPNFFENLGEDTDQPPAADPTKPSIDSVPTRTLTQSRRSLTMPFKISKRADIFGLPFPYSSRAKSVSLLLPLTNWRDTFCSEFHFWLNAYLNVWSTFITGFAKIKTASDLQKLIDCNLKDHATAFLGTDWRGSLLLLHNLKLLPGSETLFSPILQFLCLTRSAFEGSPPQLLDSDDISKILLPTSFPKIPTHAEIMLSCVTDLSNPEGHLHRPTTTPPRFSFNRSAWKALTSIPIASAHPARKDPHEFSCSSIFPVPPILTNPLMKFFDSLPDKAAKSPTAVANIVISSMIKIWMDALDKKAWPQEKDFPADCVYSLWVDNILRLLWVLEHKCFKPFPIFLEAPHNHKQAVDCYYNSLQHSFPGHVPIPSFHHQPASQRSTLPTTTNMPP